MFYSFCVVHPFICGTIKGFLIFLFLFGIVVSEFDRDGNRRWKKPKKSIGVAEDEM